MNPTESKIAALENLPLGEPWAAVAAAAEAAVASARLAAEAALFPAELEPTTETAISEYVWRTERLATIGYGEQLAALHGRSLVGHPEFARLLRSSDALDDVGAAAARGTAPQTNVETFAAAGARAASAARAKYMLAIASQIAAVPKHEQRAAAATFLEIDALSNRVRAARARHEEHATGELARVQDEQRAAHAAVAAARSRRVQEAAAAAAAASAAAADAKREARRVRADALIEALNERLGRQDRPDRLWLQTGTGGQQVRMIVSNAHDYSEDQLAMFEAALERGHFEVDASPVDPWRLA